jgi:hypothetical protein
MPFCPRALRGAQRVVSTCSLLAPLVAAAAAQRSAPLHDQRTDPDALTAIPLDPIAVACAGG